MSDTFQKPKIPFTQIANKILYSKELSMQAKFMYAYLMSKPNKWDFASARIAQETKESIYAVRSALTELEDVGYLKREKLASGRMKYQLLKNPMRTKATVDETHPGSSPLISNTEELQSNTNKTSNTETEQSSEFDFKVALEQLSNSSNKGNKFAHHIIVTKGLEFSNQNQLMAYVKRCYKPYKEISQAGYTKTHVDRTIDYLESLKLSWEPQTIVRHLANANNK